MPIAGALWMSLVAKEEARPKRTSRVEVFRDKVPWLGPLLWWLSTSYFVVQVLVASVWTPSYSWISNSISDLGNTSCGKKLCSPRHDWMNAQFLILGFVMAAGSLLIFQEFRHTDADERLAARIGFSCVAIGGVGTGMAGAFPENTVSWLHIVGAALAIGVATAGILILGLVLRLPQALRWAMRMVPPLALLALALFAVHVDLGVGAGTMERIAAYPETVWLIVFGVYISRTHLSNRGRSVMPGAGTGDGTWE